MPSITCDDELDYITRLREHLAAFVHDKQWTGWMQYVFSVGTSNPDGTWTIPMWAVLRWQRQMNTVYTALSEEEKDSDRKEADQILALLGVNG